MSEVFVLGSGFSADLAGFPTLRELSDKVFQRIQESPNSPSRTYLLDYVPAALRADLERVLTYLVQQHPWRDEEEGYIAQGAYVRAVRTIQDAFREREQAITWDGWEGKPISDLLHYWHKTEATVVTFNYDTLIERLTQKLLRFRSVSFDKQSNHNFAFLQRFEVIVDPLEGTDTAATEPKLDFDPAIKHLRITLPSRDWPCEDLVNRLRDSQIVPAEYFNQDLGQGRIRDALQRINQNIRIESLYQIPVNNISGRTASLFSTEHANTFSLLKLHGSVNWYFSGGSEFAGDQIYFTTVPTEGNAVPHLAERNARDLVPLIVPPVFDKSAFYFNNSMRAQWTMARRALKRATNVYVLGYSLPPTDLSTAFMLQTAFANTNAKLTVISRQSAASTEERQRYFQLVGDCDHRLVYRTVSTGESSIQKLLTLMEVPV